MAKPEQPRFNVSSARSIIKNLINAGVEKKLSQQNKRTRVINISSLIAASLVFFFGGGLAVISGNTSILYPAVPETILFGSAVWLNYKRQFFWSSLIWHFTFCSATLIFGVMLSTVIDATHMAGYLIGAPLLIFTKKEPKLLTACIICSIAALVGIEIITQLKLFPPLEIPGNLYLYFRIATWSTVILLNVVVILFYLQQNNILVAKLSKANAKLSNTNSKLSKASYYKTVYVNETTHELRSPLNALYSIAKLLKDKSISASDREKMYDSMEHSVNHALAVVNNVLTLAKIESGQATPLHVQNIDVREWLNEAMQTYMYQAQLKNVAFVLNVRENVPATINFPRVQVTQVLNNLVSNALKFTKSGTEIIVTVEAEEKSWRLIVEDKGVGMSDETLAKLFTPYNSSAFNNPTGTGLGMHIAKNITEQLGGDLVAKTKLNAGSTFTATFSMELAASKEPYDLQRTSILSPAKILIIDDDLIGAHYYDRILTRMGCSVEVANTGKEGMRFAESRKPDLIFLDMKLPDIDGIELLNEIKSHHSLYNIPVIFVTGSSLPEDQAAAWDLGADDYIIKPIEVSVLTRILKEYTSR